MTDEWFPLSFTDEEALEAMDIGVRRMKFARDNNLPAGISGRTDTWRDHIQSALGEKGISIITGLIWHPNIGVTTTGDVGGHEHKWIVRPHHNLAIKSKDWFEAGLPLSTCYFLTRGDYPNLETAGWISLREAMKDEWFHERHTPPFMFDNDSWVIDPQFLHPIREWNHG